MAFEITHHPTAELSVIVWRGSLAMETLKDSLAELTRAPRMRLTIWDFSHVTDVAVTKPQIESLVRETRNRAETDRLGGKTAVVVSGVFMYGLARQAQTYALLADPNPPLEIFPDRRSAVAWLGLTDGPWSSDGDSSDRAVQQS